ncbi:tRNA lysidine(34) synthetase TilS [Flavobacterium oreochromis]|uniref:tRNA(Ile)-lysidine synthase n=1 Tax=Flavobacterium oreochromis TaxID=2906078 RepID=A0ABW8P6D8_9FLAO|nr:tRNA lysidine(34) synthetase TilS [Flavobacterium oreochromis]OWP76616.1 tRNA lysidine(34) synthetase TilS [Flavobacterium oreochromis]
MLIQLRNHINQHLSFLNGKKLLLAISGGIDSIVLLNLFAKLDFHIAIAHCNFQLRGDESNQDEKFVQIESKKLKVRSFIRKFKTQEYANDNKLSIQQAARELRYNWFDELTKTEGFDYLLTAHHLDDSLETFLINFTRGTGIEGLTGIPEVNKNIIRPLLIFSREEITNYALINAINWREDSTNASDKYFRNKIRHQVVPILKELNINFLSSFQNTLKNLQQTESLAQDSIHNELNKIIIKKENEIYFDILKIQSLSNYKAYLYEWLKSYGFHDWNAIYDLIENQSGKQIFSEKYRLVKNRNNLILTTKLNNVSTEFLISDEIDFIENPIKLHFCNSGYNMTPTKSSIFVDKETLKFPLKLRKWQEGDYFYPSGMKGKKKISKYFKDEKFSLIEKEDTWLLLSEDKIIWIINHRVDNRFIAHSNSKNILNIIFTE